MAASASFLQLSHLRHDRPSWSSMSSFSCSSSQPAAPTIWMNAKSWSGLGAGSKSCPTRHALAIFPVGRKGSGSSKRLLHHVVGARRPGKDSRDGALAQAVEEEQVKIPENSESGDMWMGKKLEGLEPDFWEGEQWEWLGFILQYLWAFGILVALVACGVAVASYNSGAIDIRETEVFKEAVENQVDADSGFDSDSLQDFPQASEAPPVE